jgi:DNA topoisomerase IA
MSTLIIAEKLQAAKAIAAALGQTQPIKESKFITVLYIPSKNIYVLPLRGHILFILEYMCLKKQNLILYNV